MTRPATVPRSVQLAVARFFKAVRLFPGDAFHDERRVRERLQSLAAARFVRAFPATHGVGGPINWYKLTAEVFSYCVLHGAEADLPHRSRFEAIAPSRIQHTWALAEVIVQIVVAAHRSRTAIAVFQGDGEASSTLADRNTGPIVSSSSSRAASRSTSISRSTNHRMR